MAASGDPKFWGICEETLKTGRKLLFQGPVEGAVAAGHRLDQFEAGPLDAGPLRQTLGSEGACVPRYRDVRAVRPRLFDDAFVLQHVLERCHDAMQLLGHRRRREAGDSRSCPEFQPVKTQAEGLKVDFTSPLAQLRYPLLRIVADPGQRDMPVASINGMTFNGFGNRIDYLAKLIPLTIIRPEREKKSFCFH